MKTPDITPVQSFAGGVMSIYVALVGVLMVFHTHVTIEQFTALGGLLAALLGFIAYCDLSLRKKRLEHLPTLVQSKAMMQAVQAPADEADEDGEDEPEAPAPKRRTRPKTG